MKSTINPRSLGLPHDTWRPNQYAFYKRVYDFHKNGGGVIFGELNTGSGKSAVARALSAGAYVTVLVHTLPLLDQYRDKYGFDIIKGKPSYQCVLPGKVADWKFMYKLIPAASDCHLSEMWQCPVARKCPYLVARDRAFKSYKMACTYRYAALSFAKRTGVLIMDECDTAVEELISFNEYRISRKLMKRHGLPLFPISQYGENNRGAVISPGASKSIHNWFYRCEKILITTDEEAKLRSGASKRRTGRAFSRIMEAVRADEWFLQIEDDGVYLRSLSAVPIAQRIMEKKRTAVLMSATIGKPDPLAIGLGVGNKYESESYPHPVHPKYRPVYYSKKTPRMTKRTLAENPDQYEEQVDMIWEWISQFPVDWRGTILTTSYYKIEQLTFHLQFLLNKAPEQRRIVEQTRGMQVSDVVRKFTTDVRAGDIMVGTIQGLGTGLDLYGQLARWTVLAGTPNANPVDKFLQARRQLSGGRKYELWLTANSVMQWQGRVNRLAKDDGGEYLTNHALIADGSATVKRLVDQYGDWFKDAFVEI